MYQITDKQHKFFYLYTFQLINAYNWIVNLNPKLYFLKESWFVAILYEYVNPKCDWQGRPSITLSVPFSLPAAMSKCKCGRRKDLETIPFIFSSNARQRFHKQATKKIIWNLYFYEIKDKVPDLRQWQGYVHSHNDKNNPKTDVGTESTSWSLSKARIEWVAFRQHRQ